MSAYPATTVTGCDYTSSFLNKGKIKPMELMLKNDMYIEAMAKLGDCPDATLDIVKDRDICVTFGVYSSSRPYSGVSVAFWATLRGDTARVAMTV